MCTLAPMRLTRHWYAPYPSLARACPPARLPAYAPLLSSISVLRAFVLFCVVLLQLKGKVAMFCVCAPINQSPPVSLSSLILRYKAVLHALFHSFFLSHCLHCYLYTAITCVLFFFWNKLDKHPIFTHLTHGQILYEFLQFKHWNLL